MAIRMALQIPNFTYPDTPPPARATPAIRSNSADGGVSG